MDSEGRVYIKLNKRKDMFDRKQVKYGNQTWENCSTSKVLEPLNYLGRYPRSIDSKTLFPSPHPTRCTASIILSLTEFSPASLVGQWY